jgi:shikimate dehydrogenase
VPEIRISNRSRPRAEALRADFGAKLVVYDWVQAANMLEGAATVINTTSLGLAGKPEFRVPLDALEPGAVVNDLVYNPLKTAFLAEAEQRGATIVDGLGMLLHQAAPGFERWFGPTPAVDEATRQAVLSA